MEHALELGGAGQESTEQHCGWNGPEWVQPSEQCSHYPVETCTSGEAGRGSVGNHALALAAEDEDGACEPSQRARQCEGEGDVPFDVHPGRPRGVGRMANGS